MRRDLKMVRAILQTIAEDPNQGMSLSEIHTEINRKSPGAYQEERKIRYHLLLCEQAQLLHVDASERDPQFEVTWQGHDYIDRDNGWANLTDSMDPYKETQ